MTISFDSWCILVVIQQNLNFVMMCSGKIAKEYYIQAQNNIYAFGLYLIRVHSLILVSTGLYAIVKNSQLRI